LAGDMTDLTPDIVLRLAIQLNELIQAIEKIVEAPSWGIRRALADHFLHGEPLEPR
jgi:hypothetical protein